MILLKNEPSSLAASSGSAMCSSFICNTGAGEDGCLPERLCIRLHIAERGELNVKRRHNCTSLGFLRCLLFF